MVALPQSELVDQARYSHVFDIGSMLHKDPNLEGALYQIWTKEKNPVLLAEGSIDDIGRTVRVFTKEQKEVEIIVGENEWLSVEDFPQDDTERDTTEGIA